MELISPHGKWEWQPLNPHWPPAQILVQIQKHVCIPRQYHTKSYITDQIHIKYVSNIYQIHIKYISNIGWNTRANTGNIVWFSSRGSFPNHREGWNNCLLPSYPGYFFLRFLPMKTIVENYNDDDDLLEFLSVHISKENHHKLTAYHNHWHCNDHWSLRIW